MCTPRGNADHYYEISREGKHVGILKHQKALGLTGTTFPVWSKLTRSRRNEDELRKCLSVREALPPGGQSGSCGIFLLRRSG